MYIDILKIDRVSRSLPLGSKLETLTVSVLHDVSLKI